MLQSVYHPGLFVNNKWSCCDHRSKHSQGCTPSFCGTNPSPHNFSNVSPIKNSANIGRGPLPPTPSDGMSAPPPPSSHQHTSHYHGNHAHIPDSVQGYEHHELNGPSEKPRRGGGGGGRGGLGSSSGGEGMAGGGAGRGGRAAGGISNDRQSEPLPPPIPVSGWKCVGGVGRG